MLTERAVILLNPSAGGGKALTKKEHLEKFLQELAIPHDLFITESEEDLKELTRKNSKSCRTLVGAGGDSTYHIMINEMMKARTDANFGMIGLGSSNDIAKEFQVNSLEKACLVLKRGDTKRIDLGCIRHNQTVLRYFLGQANIGLGVLVNKYVSALTLQKPRLGRMQPVAGILGIINAYRAKKIPFSLTIESERGRMEGRFVLAVFSNIRYWATGKKISPEALPDDGRLDVCLFSECSFTRLAYLAFLAQKGKHTKAGEVQTLQSQAFEVFSEQPFEIQTDGEIIGGSGQPALFHEIQFEIVPQALKIIC